jgi:sugar phosphate permease
MALAILATLGVLYIVSQFLRSSVGVIAPNLAAEVGLSPLEIGLLSSAYFFVFAAVQLWRSTASGPSSACWCRWRLR